MKKAILTFCLALIATPALAAIVINPITGKSDVANTVTNTGTFVLNSTITLKINDVVEQTGTFTADFDGAQFESTESPSGEENISIRDIFVLTAGDTMTGTLTVASDGDIVITSGSLKLDSDLCQGKTNGGKLTTVSDGGIVCRDDTGTSGGTVTLEVGDTQVQSGDFTLDFNETQFTNNSNPGTEENIGIADIYVLNAGDTMTGALTISTGDLTVSNGSVDIGPDLCDGKANGGKLVTDGVGKVQCVDDGDPNGSGGGTVTLQVNDVTVQQGTFTADFDPTYFTHTSIGVESNFGIQDIYVMNSGDIMSGSLQFQGVTNDITTASGQDLRLNPAGLFPVLIPDGGLGIGTTNLESQIILDLESTSQALRVTRLSNPSTDITTPRNGMIAYDSTDDELQAYIAGAWTDIGGSGSGGSANSVTVNAQKGTAGTITAGQVVYITGWDSGQSVVEVELADADGSGTYPGVGIASSSITDTTTGTVVVEGIVGSINTSSYTVGDQLYLSTTAGALTTTRPTGDSDCIQPIGQVQRDDASNGEINVVHDGFCEDVPNSATPTGDWDYTSATLTVPNSTSLPGSCSNGDTYQDTNATTGQQFYVCEGSSWVAVGSGFGSSGGYQMVMLPVNEMKLTGSLAISSTLGITEAAWPSGGYDIWTVEFDETTDNGAVAFFPIPEDYASNPDLVIQYFMESATSGTVEFEAALACVDDTEVFEGMKGNIGTVAVASATVPATEGNMDVITIDLNDPGCSAEDFAAIILSTDADDATNDTATGKRVVGGLYFKYD